MTKHSEILELLFEELDRHDANIHNNAEFVTSLAFGEGLTVKEVPEFDELYDELVAAGYSANEAKRAVTKERRRLGLGG